MDFGHGEADGEAIQLFFLPNRIVHVHPCPAACQGHRNLAAVSSCPGGSAFTNAAEHVAHSVFGKWYCFDYS